MSTKDTSQTNKETTEKGQSKQPETQGLEPVGEQANSTAILERARVTSDRLTPRDVLQLQRVIGNRGVEHHLVKTIQCKSGDGRNRPLQAPNKIQSHVIQRNGYDGFEDYTIKYASNDKVIAKLNNPVYGETAIAIAKSPDRNQALLNEFFLLNQIKDNGGAAIPLYVSQIVYVRQPNSESEVQNCAAYLMKWVNGVHSKTNKPQFDNAIAGKQGSQTDQDLRSLESFLKSSNIGDLQLLLENGTGKLYIIDPLSLEAPRVEIHPFVKRWRGLIDGTIKPGVQDKDYSKVD